MSDLRFGGTKAAWLKSFKRLVSISTPKSQDLCPLRKTAKQRPTTNSTVTHCWKSCRLLQRRPSRALAVSFQSAASAGRKTLPETTSKRSEQRRQSRITVETEPNTLHEVRCWRLMGVCWQKVHMSYPSWWRRLRVGREFGSHRRRERMSIGRLFRTKCW